MDVVPTTRHIQVGGILVARGISFLKLLLLNDIHGEGNPDDADWGLAEEAMQKGTSKLWLTLRY